jgi:uncharacterized metal-binding protein
MRENTEKLFASFTPPEPPAGLFERIMRRIQEEQRLLTLKRRVFVFSVGMMVSAAAFAPALKITEAELSASGFLRFLSLAFSDFEVITAYRQNFALTLLETIPAISLALLLAVIFVFLGSLKILARDIKVVFASK